MSCISNDASGARVFGETIAFGQRAWDEKLTPEMREVFITNAPTWLDEVRDPDFLQMDQTPSWASTGRHC